MLPPPPLCFCGCALSIDLNVDSHAATVGSPQDQRFATRTSPRSSRCVGFSWISLVGFGRKWKFCFSQISLVTFTKDVVFSPLSSLLVSRITQKQQISSKLSRKMRWRNPLNFSLDPDQRSDPGVYYFSLFPLLQYRVFFHHFPREHFMDLDFKDIPIVRGQTYRSV